MCKSNVCRLFVRFCENCVKGILSGNSSFPCPMCQTSLSKPDILSVTEETEDSENGDVPKATIQSSSDFKITLKVSDNVSSTKTRALIEDLDQVRAENNKRPSDPVKSIIFSQWTTMLDLLEGPLRRSSHKFVRLDGRMSRAERTMAMERFKKDPNITIMLVSLKAGGVGLNLTSASRVYIMEPYWNPAIEQQAVDRVHRLGQKKPVDTIRFIVAGSIEDSILALQKKKMELAQMTFKEDSSGDVSAGKKTKVKRGEGRKDKEALQKERLADLRMLFNL
jgi:SNF2 family DNA or RNA helicase